MPVLSAYKIRFDDVDGAGILYYPRYFHLCHQALEDLFERGAPVSYAGLIRERRLGIPTVAIESAFTSPLEYGDSATVALSVERLGTSSVVFRFTVRRQADDAECFKAKITAVMIDLNTREPVPVPADLRAFFEGFREE